MRNLAETLIRAARMTDAGSIVFLQGAPQPRVLSYSDLLLDAARILRGMRDAGVAPGDRVLIRLADEPDLLAVFWACQLGGFVPVPLAASSAVVPDDVVGGEPWLVSTVDSGAARWLGPADRPGPARPRRTSSRPGPTTWPRCCSPPAAPGGPRR